MNRRELLMSFASVVGIPAAAQGKTASGKWGKVDASKHMLLRNWSKTKVFLRVLYRGEDVTRRCFEFDDVLGYALLYKLDDQGKAYTEFAWPRGQRPAYETIHGFTIVEERA